jgi:hypothetical protein
MLAVVDLTDEEIAAQEQEQADVFTIITVEQWRVIYARRWVSVLFDLTENNPDSVSKFLESLVKEAEARPPTARSYRTAARTDEADDDPINGIK